MNRTSVTPSPSIARPAARPCERLEADVVELASQLTAASATLTRLIGEYDAAEGWRGWGVRSTGAWLAGVGDAVDRALAVVAGARRRVHDRYAVTRPLGSARPGRCHRRTRTDIYPA